jgi:hypothetical protein
MMKQQFVFNDGKYSTPEPAEKVYNDKKIYFRNTVETDDGKVLIVRGFYYETAPFVFKQMMFSY